MACPKRAMTDRKMIPDHRPATVAPSPTGTLHLGNIRTALFAWPYARHHKGPVCAGSRTPTSKRSSESAPTASCATWRGWELDIDEGLFYQMQRIAEATARWSRRCWPTAAYHCYMSVEGV